MSNLENIMKSKNISDKCLQDEIGISSSTISKWRSRGSFPSIEVLFKMSEYFDVNINDFFEDSIIYKNKSNIDSKGGNNIMKESYIDDPLNKFVEWRFVTKYPYTAKKIEPIIFNFSEKNAEGYIFKDKFIDYYLVCIYNNNPLENDRSLYYFQYNNGIPPRKIERDEDTLSQFFDYLHKKFINEVADYFYDQHKR